MLSKEKVKDEFIQILQKEFELYSFKFKDIDMEQSIFSLGLDSVDMMVLMTILEKKYKINIPNDKYESFSTISRIVDLIFDLVNEK